MAFLRTPDRPDYNDEQLVLMYKQTGDTNVLAQLYTRYMELLYAVCFKYLKSRESAQDAVLQVYEGLGNKLKKHEPVKFSAWLYAVVKNHCLMEIRKPSYGKVISMDASFMQFAEDQHQDNILEKETQMDKLSGCIETLSTEQRTSVQLFYLQEKCYKEIVDITGFDFNKVRSLIQNGRRNLKICMEKK